MKKKQKETKAKARQCTHIKANGIRCGCPALKNEYYCYFHTGTIKSKRGRVDTRLGPMSVLEDRYAVQASIMEVMDLVCQKRIQLKEAAVLTRLLQLAVRNGRNLEFDSKEARAKMVTELPNYIRQFFVEHPEHDPPEGMFDNGREAPGEDPPQAPRKPVESEKAAAERGQEALAEA